MRGSNVFERYFWTQILQDNPILIIFWLGDLLLEVNNQTVAGLTLYDLNTIISRADDPVRLKSVREGLQIMRDLRHYLSMKTEKGSIDNDLQNMVRDNLYLRTLPCTTRTPREGEQNGIDYTFLTREQFEELERKGVLGNV